MARRLIVRDNGAKAFAQLGLRLHCRPGRPTGQDAAAKRWHHRLRGALPSRRCVGQVQLIPRIQILDACAVKTEFLTWTLVGKWSDHFRLSITPDFEPNERVSLRVSEDALARPERLQDRSALRLD